MFSFFAYGQGIRSAIPLPELVPHHVILPDVDIRFGNVRGLSLPVSTSGGCFRATSEEAHLFWQGSADMLVRKGREIIVDPAPGVSESALRLLILGPALGVLLHQRGLLVLHASAVAFRGGVVAFLGETGSGKSTLAAALEDREYPVVADDFIAVQIGSPQPMVSPGFPQIKLWPDSAVALSLSPETLPRISAHSEKRMLRYSYGFSLASMPLKTIYVLGEDSVQHIEPVCSHNALIELVRHSYCAAFIRGSTASDHFFQCNSLLRSVRVCRLKSRRSLTELPRLTELIEEDLGRSAVEWDRCLPACTTFAV